MLTKAQTAKIERIAKLDGQVSLYEETSLSGASETLRYKRIYKEQGQWGPVVRRQTGMVLSVKISALPNGNDNPVDMLSYRTKCREAKELFVNLRQQ